MLLIGGTCTMDNELNVWYLDSGALTHMKCHCEWLGSFYPKCTMHSVILGNNTTLAVHGSGHIQAAT